MGKNSCQKIMTLDGGILTLYREQREFEARSPTTQATLFILEFFSSRDGYQCCSTRAVRGTHQSPASPKPNVTSLQKRLNPNAKPLFALLIPWSTQERRWRSLCRNSTSRVWKMIETCERFDWNWTVQVRLNGIDGSLVASTRRHSMWKTYWTKCRYSGLKSRIQCRPKMSLKDDSIFQWDLRCHHRCSERCRDERTTSGKLH